jgi:hypothetical protein
MLPICAYISSWHVVWIKCFDRLGFKRWQLTQNQFADGMESYSEGYEVVLTQAPSRIDVIARQTYAMSELANMIN